MSNRDLFWINSETEALLRTLRRIDGDAIPHAARSFLTGSAFDVRDAARKNVEDEFIVRKKRTVEGIKARYGGGDRNVQNMWATAYNSVPWLDVYETEDNPTKRAKGGGMILSPTPAARTSKSINRAVAKRFRLREMADFGADTAGAPFMLYPSSDTGTLTIPTVFVRKGKRLIPIYESKGKTMALPRRRFFSRAVEKEASHRAMMERWNRKVRRQFEKALERIKQRHGK